MPDPVRRARGRGLTTSRAAGALISLALTALLLACFAAPSFADTTSPSPGTSAAAASPRAAATAPAGPPPTLFRSGDNALLEYGETVEAVVVLDGNADIAGTVRTFVVVIGGDAVIRSTAVIGEDLTRRDVAVFVIGGTVKESPGAQVSGTTQVVSLTAPRFDIAGTLWDLIAHPGISALDWLRRFLFYGLVSIVVVALFPRPVRALRERAFASPLAALGWGSLTAFMAAVVLLILAATIIGLIVVVPALMVSPLVALFVWAATAFAIGDAALSRIWPGDRSRFLAAVTGALVMTLAGMIPIVGGLAVGAAWLIGLGAATLALVDWRRARQARGAGPSAPVG